MGNRARSRGPGPRHGAEQAEAARRFLGEAGGREYVEHADHPETIMARIALIPGWVGVLDFRTRAPSIIGG